MRRWTLATAMTLLLTASACGGADPEEIDPDADEPAASEDVLVPVERSSELVDPEGSTVGTAWLRDSDNEVVELEVEVSGLTQGFHGLYLYEATGCDALDEEAPAAVLSPMLVLANGIGSVTTLVGPVDLEGLLDGAGATLVISDAVDAPDGVTPALTGSSVACGSFGG